ncbi:transposase [Thalassobaculum litoreum]|uniref:Transposase DDE domain-containing protein n=1 Tax=Thalassobaculum litoreum DSM 18839 TaxID=1123362 RepID=A0A8G2BLI5_9PROT|nr:transposase [Thalassobaculum litoreum]SDG17838.1 Transposase DDE domain-containing protein [Thalassobaculum litoreum DSM 18839]
MVADRGYYAQAIIDLIETRGAKAHIPSQINVRVRRSVDHQIYRQRNLVERFFNRLKHFRAIATRYHKLARNFLAAIALASTRLWIKKYGSTT